MRSDGGWIALIAMAAIAGLAPPAGAEPTNVIVPPPKVEVGPGGEAVVVHEGEASYYGGRFHGRKTATGERFDQNKPTAASTELPLGTKATVTNKENGRQLDVTVNDRGPYVDGRVIDLSRGAARELGITSKEGVADVRVEAKPSDQPTEKAKDKVEEKAVEVVQEGGAANPAAGRAALRQAGKGAPAPDRAKAAKPPAGGSKAAKARTAETGTSGATGKP